jgi:hypothetical protein
LAKKVFSYSFFTLCKKNLAGYRIACNTFYDIEKLRHIKNQEEAALPEPGSNFKETELPEPGHGSEESAEPEPEGRFQSSKAG